MAQGRRFGGIVDMVPGWYAMLVASGGYCSLLGNWIMVKGTPDALGMFVLPAMISLSLFAVACGLYGIVKHAVRDGIDEQKSDSETS